MSATAKQKRHTSYRSKPRLSRRILTRGTKENRALVLVLLLAILANAALYVFTHIEGPSVFADDPNYLYLASTVVNGNYMLNPGYIFSLRLGMFLPIAASYYLFGVTNLTSTLWDAVAFLGTVLATFLLVRKLYDDKAALMAAFLMSIFPLAAQYAVNTSEDVPLMFVGLLALLFFIYAEDGGKKRYYFASGAMLVFAWTISYEAGVIIVAVLLYALIQLTRRKITINRNSLFFVYGIAIPLLILFIYSSLAIAEPFVLIGGNTRFYSAVGTTVNGLPTIPTTNSQPFFYLGYMFQYRLSSILLQSGNPSTAITNLANTFSAVPQNYGYGVYFYIVFPAIAALLILRERRAYLLIGVFAAYLLLLSFGPMHIGVSLNPFRINYLLAYRIDRFIMILAPAMAGIIGIALAKALEARRAALRCLSLALILLLFAFMYYNYYMITFSYYWWQMYPQQIVMQASNFLRYNVTGSPYIYLEGTWNNVTVTYTGAEFPTYIGDPSATRIDWAVTPETSCSSFSAGSYVVWSGPPLCGNWIDRFNVTTPIDAPAYFVKYETPMLVYPPTNVYYVSAGLSASG